MVGMTVFDGYGDSLGEMDRIHQVKSVAHLIAGNDAFVQGRAVHQEGVILHSPRVIKIVFTACPMKARRPRILIDKNHLVAFAPPTSLKVRDRKVTSHIVSPAPRLED